MKLNLTFGIMMVIWLGCMRQLTNSSAEALNCPTVSRLADESYTQRALVKLNPRSELCERS